ncbi:LysR family transcriptional regulator [Hoeflea sp. YIM 152468]|uniref:LysR family transcriptional regulator n=1 Tax=Hoeflea sp. YIM 152468 TaxID=3031759 RepID=UPI0023DC8662|nr:LysR family transcriptional regulator [Hoeflea sp. YIM 152468]MDF1606995.1 LysR family transcriptional regulator [Hoeflea sp. YIM 152468]
MENWDEVRYFLAVVRQGSISAAAETLRVNHTTVSRRIAALEAQLDVRLFDRRKTGFVPTKEAAQLIDAAEEIEAGAMRISRLALAKDTRLEGVLRITAPLVLMHYVLAPIFAAFKRDYPDVELYLQGSDEIYNLINRESDVALRVTAAPMETLYGYKVADTYSGLYAAPSLLAERCVDAAQACSVDDLNWISEGEDVSRPSWHQHLFPNGRLACHCDNKLTAINAAVQGMGVIELPTVLGKAEPGLVRLQGYEVKSEKGIWVLYHRDLRNTARVQAFVSAMRAASIGR